MGCSHTLAWEMDGAIASLLCTACLLDTGARRLIPPTTLTRSTLPETTDWREELAEATDRQNHI